MVSYLDRFLQDGIEATIQSTTKVETETGYRLLCIYIHIQVEARLVALWYMIYYTKSKNFSGH